MKKKKTEKKSQKNYFSQLNLSYNYFFFTTLINKFLLYLFLFASNSLISKFADYSEFRVSCL